MDENQLSINESQVMNKVIANGTSSISGADMSALIGGLIHATTDLSTAVFNAICEDKKLRAEMIAHLHTTVQAIIDDDSENIRKSLASNEANMATLRALIGSTANVEISDERLRMLFDELRYYDSRNQDIIDSQRQFKSEAFKMTAEAEQRMAMQDSIVIPKAAIREGAKTVLTSPYTWKFIVNLILKRLR